MRGARSGDAPRVEFLATIVTKFVFVRERRALGVEARFVIRTFSKGNIINFINKTPGDLQKNAFSPSILVLHLFPVLCLIA